MQDSGRRIQGEMREHIRLRGRHDEIVVGSLLSPCLEPLGGLSRMFLIQIFLLTARYFRETQCEWVRSP